MSAAFDRLCVSRIALALLLGLTALPGTASAQSRDDDLLTLRQRELRPPTPQRTMPNATRTLAPGRMQAPGPTAATPPSMGMRAPTMQSGGGGRAEPGQAYPGRGQRFQTGRGAGERMPGRVARHPGRGGWGAGAVGIGAGILGGILLDQAMRRPVYDYEDELPPPRRGRRPVIVEEYEADEPSARPRRPVPARAAAPPPQTPPRTGQPGARQPNVIVPPVAERRFVAEEILLALAPGAAAEPVLRRHRATLIETRRFALADSTIIRARLRDGRSARTVLTAMAGDASIASAQPNYLYSLQDDPVPAPAEAQPALAAEPAQPNAAAALDPRAIPAPPVPVKRELQPQYVADKLHFDDIHKLARGERIKVAVIDSAADRDHRELQGVLAGSFDALGGEAPAHAHGTAMAAAILAQAQLQGVAPAARLLAARAFSGGAPGSANGTTFHILASLDWAAEQGARVVNLSFAGPQDKLLSQALAGARTKGMVAVAAAGNGGAKAAPLYPGADPNVIAVTATDADDKPFAGANRGGYIAVAAPGVDVLAAEPQGRYAFSSGTSIAAAHVSGLVALILEKRPDLDLDGVRKLLMESAIDLGAKGRDPVFGAGRVDPAAALARALPISATRP